MIFNTIGDILYTKQGNQLDDIDNEKEYSPYMVNRWLSMYSDNIAFIVNETVNKFYPILSNKKEHYNFLCKVIPKSYNKRINYIKKEKNESKIDEKVVTFLAKNLELSTREILCYIESGAIDYKSIANKLKHYESKS